MYEYDDPEMNPIKIQVFKNGNLVTDEDYFYNAEGFQIGSEWLNFETNEKVVIEMELNSRGQILKEEQYLNDVLEYKKTCVYNKNHDLIEVEFWPSNSGQEIETKEIIRYEYEYF